MTRSEFALLDHCFQHLEQVFMQWWIARQPPPMSG
jgi:hypothetical protein